jgi:hypothetical protein
MGMLRAALVVLVGIWLSCATVALANPLSGAERRSVTEGMNLASAAVQGNLARFTCEVRGAATPNAPELDDSREMISLRAHRERLLAAYSEEWRRAGERERRCARPSEADALGCTMGRLAGGSDRRRAALSADLALVDRALRVHAAQRYTEWADAYLAWVRHRVSAPQGFSLDHPALDAPGRLSSGAVDLVQGLARDAESDRLQTGLVAAYAGCASAVRREFLLSNTAGITALAGSLESERDVELLKQRLFGREGQDPQLAPLAASLDSEVVRRRARIEALRLERASALEAGRRARIEAVNSRIAAARSVARPRLDPSLLQAISRRGAQLGTASWLDEMNCRVRGLDARQPLTSGADAELVDLVTADRIFFFVHGLALEAEDGFLLPYQVEEQFRAHAALVASLPGRNATCFVSWRSLEWIGQADRLARALRDVQAIAGLPAVFDANRRVVVVGYSAGGNYAKRAIVESMRPAAGAGRQGRPRVPVTLVTMGTPHNGSRLASMGGLALVAGMLGYAGGELPPEAALATMVAVPMIANLPGVRELRPLSGNPSLAAINRDYAALNHETYSVFSDGDALSPPSASTVPFARSVPVSGMSHEDFVGPLRPELEDVLRHLYGGLGPPS